MRLYRYGRALGVGLVLLLILSSCGSGSSSDVALSEALSPPLDGPSEADGDGVCGAGSSSDAVVSYTSPVEALGNRSLEWVYVDGLSLTDDRDFSEFFDDTSAQSMRISGVEVVRPATEPLVEGSSFQTGAEPLAFLGSTGPEAIAARESGSRVLLALIRLVHRSGEAQVGLSPSDGEEIQFAVSAFSVASDGVLTQLGQCGRSELVDPLNDFAANSGDGRSAIELLEAVIAGDEVVIGELMAVGESDPGAWED